MDKKVANKKESIKSLTSFNEEDILQDVLASMKHLSTIYGTLSQEASNAHLLKKIEPLAKQVAKMARDSFNLMFKKGWYTLEAQVPKKIEEEYNKFKKKGQSL